MFIPKMCRLKDGSSIEAINLLTAISIHGLPEPFDGSVSVKHLSKNASWYKSLKKTLKHQGADRGIATIHARIHVITSGNLIYLLAKSVFN